MAAHKGNHCNEIPLPHVPLHIPHPNEKKKETNKERKKERKENGRKGELFIPSLKLWLLLPQECSSGEK